ncbi:tetratricopeptide repeat protein [Nonomuraea sp. NEAU-A123]|uniref:tetratricopeptide repeat protein n=1 Tax=Nonomuraea sp. NEAU-A123 TaxID=2839649 RepID=UPI001BE4BE6B|nr:tetratricopeptide repeat protein [Nonomuraea sp. NEAU-A123]MBT2231659.1 tetratricopeptide repeat protein [Nonomuraea sp. NEAU-A123]
MHHSLGLAQWRMADLKNAMDHHERALALSRRAGWPLGEARALQGCGVVLKQLGEPHKAFPRYRRSVEIHHSLGSVRVGHYERAIDVFGRSLAIAMEVENRRCQIASLIGMAGAELELGSVNSALARLDAALELAEDTGIDLDEVLLGRAELLYRQGRYADARDEADRSLKLAFTSNLLNVPRLHGLLAAIHLAVGDGGQCVDACEQALEHARRSGQRLDYARALMTLGHAVKGRGREESRRLWGQAHALFMVIGAPERSTSAALLAGSPR